MLLLTCFFLLWPLTTSFFHLAILTSVIPHWGSYSSLNTVNFSITFQQSSFGHLTQQSFIGHVTKHNLIGLKTQHSSIGHMTQHSLIGPMTQQSLIDPMTQPCFINSMTQPCFCDPMNQQCFIDKTQIYFPCCIIQHYHNMTGLMPLCEYPILSCPTSFSLSTLYNYAQKIWIKLISSSLLEFYIRTIFVILQSFDIIFENDFPLYKCLQIKLNLRRHFYKSHDYKVLADKVTNCSAICIHPTPMLMKFFTHHIFAFQIIYIFILEPVLSPALYLFDVLIYDIYYQIILCYKDLDYSESQTTKARGGGLSYEFNYDDLSCYSDQVSTNMKYIFYTYVLEAENFLSES